MQIYDFTTHTCSMGNVYHSENGNSRFKYYDDEKHQVVTLNEKPGWQVNRFIIPQRPKKFWHCVESDTHRVSIGLHILPKVV
jgi:hypothetical protein